MYTCFVFQQKIFLVAAIPTDLTHVSSTTSQTSLTLTTGTPSKKRSVECQMEDITHSKVFLIERVSTNENISDELNEGLQDNPIRVRTGKNDVNRD